jgi:hypothetical protein
LFFSAYAFDDPMVEVCDALPLLTHFGFEYAPKHVDESTFLSLTKGVLSSNPSLKMVILDSFSDNWEPAADLVGSMWIELARLADQRLLVRPGLPEKCFNTLLESGETMWDNARERFGNWRESVRSERRVD